MKGPLIFAIIFLSFCLIVILFDIISLIKRHNNLTRKQVFKFIDNLLLYISLIIIPCSLLFDFNFLQYKSPIEYNSWRTITLNDFRGFNKPFQTLDGESKFAFVHTSIEVKKNHNMIDVKSYFHPCRSYVYNRKLFSQDLLIHELYHFHITEYCARLMRKEVKEISEHSKIENLEEIKNNIIKQERLLQFKYDDETYHGYVSSKQIEWQNKIDSSLTSLIKYSKTIIYLKN